MIHLIILLFTLFITVENEWQLQIGWITLNAEYLIKDAISQGQGFHSPVELLYRKGIYYMR